MKYLCYTIRCVIFVVHVTKAFACSNRTTKIDHRWSTRVTNFQSDICACMHASITRIRWKWLCKLLYTRLEELYFCMKNAEMKIESRNGIRMARLQDVCSNAHYFISWSRDQFSLVKLLASTTEIGRETGAIDFRKINSCVDCPENLANNRWVVWRFSNLSLNLQRGFVLAHCVTDADRWGRGM